MDLGKRMRATRKSKGWTLEKFHQISGISISTLSQWENNKTKPGMQGLTRWAESMNIDVWSILYDPDEEIITDQEIALIHAYRSLAESDQRYIRRLLHTMQERDRPNK